MNKKITSILISLFLLLCLVNNIAAQDDDIPYYNQKKTFNKEFIKSRFRVSTSLIRPIKKDINLGLEIATFNNVVIGISYGYYRPREYKFLIDAFEEKLVHTFTDPGNRIGFRFVSFNDDYYEGFYGGINLGINNLPGIKYIDGTMVLGGQIKLYKGLNLQIEIGLGINYYDKEKTTLWTISEFPIAPILLLNTTLGYTF
jgi:hypothetical protein